MIAATAPPVGSRVRLVRNVSYPPYYGVEGVVLDYQTRIVATVRWETGEWAGCHQTVRIDRLAVSPPAPWQPPT